MAVCIWNLVLEGGAEMQVYWDLPAPSLAPGSMKTLYQAKRAESNRVGHPKSSLGVSHRSLVPRGHTCTLANTHTQCVSQLLLSVKYV